MKKVGFIICCLCFMAVSVWAQDEDEKEKKGKREEREEKEGGFKKSNLFAGGSISLALYDNTFSVGGNPEFGYSIAKWLDLGLVVNYTYTSYRDVVFFDDKLRLSVYGGGSFVRVYPLRFLFAQAQFEHNFLRQKYIPDDGNGPSETDHFESNSFLIGGGYTTSRYPENGRPFFYIAVLFDVADNEFSPYTDAFGRAIPIVRAGIQVPLFQRSSRR